MGNYLNGLLFLGGTTERGRSMKRLIILIVALALLAACEQGIYGEGNITPQSMPDVATTPDAPLNKTAAEQPSQTVSPAPNTQVPIIEGRSDGADRFTIIRTEGDLVVLAPEAIDPDGDHVTYAFTHPFDARGRWQTAHGDEGVYDITVTASDPKGASTDERVRVIILRANRPPLLSCPAMLTVKEGETISLDCRASDPDGEAVKVTYEGWMIGKSYTTTYDDAGTHTVTVTAEDASGNSVRSAVKVTVVNVNRPPVFPFDFPDRIEAEEGDIIALDVRPITDPDGDKVTILYAKPFDANGVWRSKLGDAGTYNVDVVASDGTESVKKRVTIEVGMQNTAPVLKRIPDLRVYEGETIRIVPEATDRESTDLEFEISGWLKDWQYTTTYDDAGSYSVKVTVSDGQYMDSQVVHITVVDRNRPPAFIVPG